MKMENTLNPMVHHCYAIQHNFHIKIIIEKKKKITVTMMYKKHFYPPINDHQFTLVFLQYYVPFPKHSSLRLP